MKKKWIVLFVIVLVITIIFIAYKYNAYKEEKFTYQSLVHLHEKYNIPYSDMKIIEKSSPLSEMSRAFNIGPRIKNITVRYGEHDIFVHYYYGAEKWVDNYQELKEYKKAVSATREEIKEIIEKYTNEYYIVLDHIDARVPDSSIRSLPTYSLSPGEENWKITMYKGDCGFQIFLLSINQNDLNLLPNELKKYSKEYNKIDDVSWDLYVLNNQELLNKIRESNFSNINTDNGNPIEPSDIFKYIIGSDYKEPWENLELNNYNNYINNNDNKYTVFYWNTGMTSLRDPGWKVLKFH